MLEKPWARVKDPHPIPSSPDPGELLGLDDVSFAELIRDQLLPRAPQERAAWQGLWDALFDSDHLADRTFDVLEGFLEQVTQARDSVPNIDEHELKRMRKFERNVEGAWARLQNVERLPAPVVVRRLVFAITKHRALTRQHGTAVPSDEELWRTLSRLGLDPEDS